MLTLTFICCGELVLKNLVLGAAMSELITHRGLFLGVVAVVYFRHDYMPPVNTAVFVLTHSSRVSTLEIDIQPSILASLC